MKIFNNYESDKALLSQRLSYCFSRMCFQHENAAACWYHIQHIENSDRNLSSYFELDAKGDSPNRQLNNLPLTHIYNINKNSCVKMDQCYN